MELAKELLLKLLEKETVCVTLSMFEEKLGQLFANTCVIALNEIRNVIINDDLSDFQCVEQIIQIFERLGSDGGNRHDYG